MAKDISDHQLFELANPVIEMIRDMVDSTLGMDNDDYMETIEDLHRIQQVILDRWERHELRRQASLARRIAEGRGDESDFWGAVTEIVTMVK